MNKKNQLVKMSDDALQKLSLEQILDRMLDILQDYISLQKENGDKAAIYNKQVELEQIHETIRAKQLQSPPFKY